MSDTPAPPAGMKKKEKDAKKIDDGYAKKAAKARGGGEMSERLTAVGAIAKAISGEVQKVIIGKSHVIDNVMVNILSNGNLLFEDRLLYTSPSPRDLSTSRMPSSA